MNARIVIGSLVLVLVPALIVAKLMSSTDALLGGILVLAYLNMVRDGEDK